MGNDSELNYQQLGERTVCDKADFGKYVNEVRI